MPSPCKQFEVVRALVAETVPIDEIELLAIGLAFASDTTKQEAIDLSRDDLFDRLKAAGATSNASFDKMAVTAFAQLVFERIAILEQAAWGRG